MIKSCMALDLVESTRGKWPSILMALGLDGKYFTGQHLPCPMCRGRDRFRMHVNDDYAINGAWICGQCGHGDGFALVQAWRNVDFAGACRLVESVIGKADVAEQKKPVDKTKYLKQMAQESLSVRPSDPVWEYLQARCGPLAEIPRSLRHHPALWHSTAKSTYPAMLALCGFDGQKYHGIHRTYLHGDGGKLDLGPDHTAKKIYGAAGIIDLGGTGRALVAEGIETALCARQLYGGHAYACCSAIMMPDFRVEGIAELLVCGDADSSYTGQAAAYELARRSRQKNIAVEVVLPEIGMDFADVWAEKRYLDDERAGIKIF